MGFDACIDYKRTAAGGIERGAPGGAVASLSKCISRYDCDDGPQSCTPSYKGGSVRGAGGRLIMRKLRSQHASLTPD